MRNMKKILVMALVLVMLLSVLPMTTMAAMKMEDHLYDTLKGMSGPGQMGFIALFPSIKDDLNCNYKSYFDINAIPDITIDSKGNITTDPQKYIFTTEGTYELIGVHLIDWDDISDKSGNFDAAKAWKVLDKTSIKNAIDEFSIPAPPDPSDPSYTDEAFRIWMEQYGLQILAYVPHTHKLTGWLYSPTNHWRNCLACNQWYIGMNWHYDGDNDSKCDVCHGEIVYYHCNVAETKNGTVKIEKDEFSLYERFYPEITPAEGYVVDEVHLIQHNDVRSEAIRWTDWENGKIYYEMPPYECDLVVTFKEK